jgi:hypothetical protein
MASVWPVTGTGYIGIAICAARAMKRLPTITIANLAKRVRVASSAKRSLKKDVANVSKYAVCSWLGAVILISLTALIWG